MMAIALTLLVVDDYGDWQGARHATDEYLRHHPEFPILLFPIHQTGRIAIQVPAEHRVSGTRV